MNIQVSRPTDHLEAAAAGSRRGVSRCGNSSMMRFRSASLILDHDAISSTVRPQPRQKPVPGSSTHTLMQGVAIAAIEAHGPIREQR
jgi:hypothetical protein